MYSPTRKAPRGVGERPTVGQSCFLRACCHFLSKPDYLYAVEERPGSVGMPSWGAPATPRECPGRSKECPGGSKTVLRSGPSHPRVIKNVTKTPADTENHDFLKIDVLPDKNLVLGGAGDQNLTKSGPQTLPSEPQTTQNADFSTQRCPGTANAVHLRRFGRPKWFKIAPKGSPRRPQGSPRASPWDPRRITRLLLPLGF